MTLVKDFGKRRADRGAFLTPNLVALIVGQWQEK